jgi:hypothetical protein
LARLALNVSRMANRIQLSTDGHRMYEGTVGPAFNHQIDRTQIHKTYASSNEPGKWTCAASPGSLTGSPAR